MPNAQHWRWLIVFTVPADNHEHEHTAVHHNLDDELFVRRFWKTNVNPDSRIVSVTRLTMNPDEDERIVGEAKEAAMKKSGENYRVLTGVDAQLRQRQVDKLSADREALLAEHGIDPANA